MQKFAAKTVMSRVVYRKFTKLMQKFAAKTRRYVRIVHRKVHKVNAKIRSKDPSSCQESSFTKLMQKFKDPSSCQESFTAKFTKLMQKFAAKTRRYVRSRSPQSSQQKLMQMQKFAAKTRRHVRSRHSPQSSQS